MSVAASRRPRWVAGEFRERGRRAARGFAVAALLAASFAVGAPVVAAEAAVHFVRTDALDFLRLLPPPAAAGSPAAAADLNAVLQVQAWRSAEQVAWARRVDDGSLYVFADALGPWFHAERLPVTAALLEAVDADQEIGVGVAKRLFARPRPFVTDDRVQPCVPRLADFSYPSGHAVQFFVEAGVLAELIPEKRADLMDLAARLAWGRVIGGVHYPTDLEAGRLLAAAIVDELKKTPAFQAAVSRSRAEIAAAAKAR